MLEKCVFLRLQFYFNLSYAYFLCFVIETPTYIPITVILIKSNMTGTHGVDKTKQKRKPRTPGIPKRSPIQVLTGLDVA